VVLAVLLASIVAATPLHCEEEPFQGLWYSAGTGQAALDNVLYGHVLRFRARAQLRAAGMLPEVFRVAEDSLGLSSDRYDDFVYLSDSLGLGTRPPSYLPVPARGQVTVQVTPEIDQGWVEESTLMEGTPVQPPVRFTTDEYLAVQQMRSFRSLWRTEADRALKTIQSSGGGKSGLVGDLELDVKVPEAIQGIVGRGKPNLQINGSERISFSGTSRWYPDRPVTEFQRKQSKFPQLDMKQELNLQLTGNIGDKVSVDVDQSSQASTPLANRIKIHYKGYEDEILQKVELGNTSLSLPGTRYVSYSGRHEGLFGINTQALFGDVEIAAILSKQEGKNETRTITKSAEVQNFEIQDWQYKQGRFFFLIDPDGPPLSNLDVNSVEVWIDDRLGANNNEQLTIPGYVTLDGSFRSKTQRATGDFNRLNYVDDFIVQTDVYFGYPVLILDDAQTLDGRMTKALGVSYRSTDGSVVVGGYRGSDPDSLVLKLIRPASEMGPEGDPGTNPLDLTQGYFAPTRKLELRNVYNLGSDITSEGLTARIRRKTTQGGIVDPDRIGDHTFLEILGLDLFTDAGAQQIRGADGKIDNGRINLSTGWVIFTELQPFAPTPEDIRRRFTEARPDTLQGEETVPELYTRNDWSSGDPNEVSQYKFEVTTRRAAQRISLGFNLLQGSESVTAGGRTLVRDREYTIDYDTGEIEILDAADLRDTDEIAVSYSHLPFGGGGQKTLIGSAIRLRPESSKLGLSTTWMYESKGSPGIEGRRPRLGQEPTRTVVGELATSYKTDSWMLTSLVDALPGVTTRAKSNVTFESGVGLSFPNPNTRGQLYVDDFEGAKDEFLVSMNRLGWKPSGVPAGVAGVSLAERLRRRAECWWYSPRAAVKEGDLQPTLESRGGLADTEKDNNRQILEIHYFPNGGADFDSTESWFSLVQPLSQRGIDLSRAQFLDVWINDFIPFDRRDDRRGRMHIEIGVVSEDAIWKRVRPELLSPDSFDANDPTLGFNLLNSEDTNQDGQLDDPGGGGGEDVGIDTFTDPEEGAGEDPAFDNWDFEEAEEEVDRLEPAADPERTARYAKIDGTEGNGRLDSEDLNGNLILDTAEGYFHFAADLADTSIVEFESSRATDQDPKYAPYTRGWRRIRIPLAQDFYTTVGTPIWEQIRHMRIWFEGFPQETYLQVGGIDITGNRWLKAAVRDSLGTVIPDSLLLVGEDFFPAVLNNKDNSTSEYNPPFKPRERQDVEEREQSLTLEMRNFGVGHQGTVYRTFSQPQDFAGLYEDLQFYLNSRIREGARPELDFFVRFAKDAITDTTNYYEYRTRVPEDWVLQNVDMGELSRLALLDTCATGICEVSKTLPDGSVILRKGKPNLTYVQRIAFGVINRGPSAVVSGNVWINELRLASVKRDTGVATRFSFGTNLADFAAFSTNYQRTDANFLSIGKDRGSGRTSTEWGFTTRANLDKFVERARIRLPVSYTMNESKQVPKFQTSSDLVLDRATDRDITEGSNTSITASLSRERSEVPWMRYTIDGVSLNGQITRSENNDPQTRRREETRSAGATYTLPLSGGPGIRVYKKTELHLLPNSFSASMTASNTKPTEYNRRNGDLNQDFIRVPRLKTRTQGLGWTTGFKPLEAINYTFNQNRDLQVDVNDKRIAGLNIGTETSRRHQLTASQSIVLLKQSLNLVPKATWNSSFDGYFNQIQTSGASARERSNQFNNQSTLTLSTGLPIQRLLGWLPRPGRRGGEGPETAEPAPGDTTGGEPPPPPPRRGASSPAGGGGFLALKPVLVTYTIGKTNRLTRVSGEPSIGYQLGWARDAGRRVHRWSVSTSNNGDRDDWNLSTELTLLGEVTVKPTYSYSTSRNSLNGGVSTTKTRRFPDLTVGWGRLHKKLGLEKLAKEFRASSGYMRQVSENASGGAASLQKTRTTQTTLNPLLNVDATLANGVTAKLSSRYDSGRTESHGGTTTNILRNLRRTLDLTFGKSVNLTRMVTNPVTKRSTRVTSKVDLSLGANWSDDKSESETLGRKTTTKDAVRLSFSTSAGYNFTSSITGNGAVSFSQDTDRKNRQNTTRSISVTLSAAFRF
jgi:hypothetical protein